MAIQKFGNKWRKKRIYSEVYFNPITVDIDWFGTQWFVIIVFRLCMFELEMYSLLMPVILQEFHQWNRRHVQYESTVSIRVHPSHFIYVKLICFVFHRYAMNCILSIGLSVSEQTIVLRFGTEMNHVFLLYHCKYTNFTTFKIHILRFSTLFREEFNFIIFFTAFVFEQQNSNFRWC